jgi:hypothetical protein
MKVINTLHQEFKSNIGIKSISSLKNFCFNPSDITKLGENDIKWIKSHKDQVLGLHEELLLTKGATEALCNLELIGEMYFGDLDLI